MTIVMEHISPSTLLGFWRNHVWRGSFSAPDAYYFRRMPSALIVLRESVKAVRTILLDLLVIPLLYRCVQFAQYTPRRLSSVPGLLMVSLVQDAAIILGNFVGVVRLVRTVGISQFSQPGTEKNEVRAGS